MFFDVSAGQSSVKNLEKSDLDSDVSAVGTLNSSKIDDMGVYWAATVGYRFMPYLAADFGWTSLGSQTYKANFITSSGVENRYKVALESRGLTTGITGILPLGKRIELRGRAGLFFANTAINRENKNSFQTTVDYTEEDSIEFFASIAAAYKFTPTFSAYLSVHHFNKVGAGDITGESDVTGASLGVTFRQ